MSDRLAEIRARLDWSGPVHRYGDGQAVAHPRTVEFHQHAEDDIRYLLALVDDVTECGCPIARVRMHTDKCKGPRA